MAKRGGYRPGAGRPPKSAGTFRVEQPPGAPPLPKGNQLPLEYMLDVMNDPSIDPARRDRMAIAAAPFCHGRPGEKSKKETKDDAAQAVSTGRFASGRPPTVVQLRPVK